MASNLEIVYASFPDPRRAGGGCAGVHALAAAPAQAETGPRVEALVGWTVFRSMKGSMVWAPATRAVSPMAARFGYDYQIAPVVSIGADVEADGSTARYRGGSSTLNAGRDFYFGGRATLALSPLTHVHAKVVMPMAVSPPICRVTA
jgi:hypothetical protein